jgi:predicted nucleic acid binding AN1-type Zn finger protein
MRARPQRTPKAVAYPPRDDNRPAPAAERPGPGTGQTVARCEYCGSRVGTGDKCPNCGAPY